MITYIIIEMHCKHRVQNLQGVLTARCLTHFTNASRGVCFEHVQNKGGHMVFWAIAQRFHSLAGSCTASFLATFLKVPMGGYSGSTKSG